jgi:hypothetical protein
VGLEKLQDVGRFGQATSVEGDEALLAELLRLVGIPPTQYLKFRDAVSISRMSLLNPGQGGVEVRRMARDLVQQIRQLDQRTQDSKVSISKRRTRTGSINESWGEDEDLVSGGALYRHWGCMIEKRPMNDAAAELLSNLLRNFTAMRHIEKSSAGKASTPQAADTPHTNRLRQIEQAKAQRVASADEQFCDVLACVLDASAVDETKLGAMELDAEQLLPFFETAHSPDGSSSVTAILGGRRGISLPRLLALWTHMMAENPRMAQYVTDMHDHHHIRECSMPVDKHDANSDNAGVAAVLRKMLAAAQQGSEQLDKDYSRELSVLKVVVDRATRTSPCNNNGSGSGHSSTSKRSQQQRLQQQFPELVIENQANVTIRHNPKSLKWHSVVLRNLDQVEIQIMDPTSSVRIERCVDCDIVIGPVKGVVSMVDVHGCEIAVAAKRLTIADSTDCSLYTYTKHRAVISSSFGLRFSYWNVAYPFLEAQFKHCSFDVKLNQWDRVYDLTADKYKDRTHFTVARLPPPLYSILISGVGAACENPLHRYKYIDPSHEASAEDEEGEEEEEEDDEFYDEEDMALMEDERTAEEQSRQFMLSIPDPVAAHDPTFLQAKVNIGSGLAQFLEFWHSVLLPFFQQSPGYKVARLLFLSSNEIMMESKWATPEDRATAASGTRVKIESQIE